MSRDGDEDGERIISIPNKDRGRLRKIAPRTVVVLHIGSDLPDHCLPRAALKTSVVEF